MPIQVQNRGRFELQPTVICSKQPYFHRPLAICVPYYAALGSTRLARHFIRWQRERVHFNHVAGFGYPDIFILVGLVFEWPLS